MKNRTYLIRLIELGLVDTVWRGNCKIYFLTQKGLTEIEKTRKAYVPTGLSTDHLQLITEAICMLYISEGISIYDVDLDRDFISKKIYKNIGHAPDIVYANTCVEVELTPKILGRLEDNIKTNAEHFEEQIWIVPQRLKALQSNIIAYCKKYHSHLELITVEELIEFVSTYDVTTNSPRMDANPGLAPRMIIKNKEVVLDE